MENTSIKPNPAVTVISMMINPSSVLKTAIMGTSRIFSVLVSGLAFGLFFFQTGLDLFKTGQKEFSFALVSAGAGVAYGITIIPALAVIIWVIMKAARTDKSLGYAISSICLSYSGALIYGICGLAFSLALGWRTSVAFGATGVLWATGPLIMSIREMSGGKSSLGIPLATIIGAAVLFSWSLFGKL